MDNYLIARELIGMARKIAAGTWTDGERTEGMFDAVCEYCERKGFNAVKRDERNMTALYARNIKATNTNAAGLFYSLHYTEQNEIVDEFKKHLGKSINIDGRDVEVANMKWDDVADAMLAFSSHDTWIDGVFKAAGGVTSIIDIHADNAGHIILDTYCMLGRTTKFAQKARLQRLDMAPLRNFEDAQDVSGWLTTNLDRHFLEFGR